MQYAISCGKKSLVLQHHHLSPTHGHMYSTGAFAAHTLISPRDLVMDNIPQHSEHRAEGALAS